jgi:ADP-ribose pyrophosphatase YjhB (NUDIX family)
MPTLGVFAAIVDDGGRILCVRMNYATHGWTTPGGRVEAGESPLYALQREVREESGLDVIADGLVGVYCKPYKDDIVLFFRARVLGRNPWGRVPSNRELVVPIGRGARQDKLGFAMSRTS